MTPTTIALTLAAACLLLACCGCTATPAPDAGLPPPRPSQTLHVGPEGCTVIVVDRADGTEQDLCLSATDLAPIIEARARAGRH